MSSSLYKKNKNTLSRISKDILSCYNQVYRDGIPKKYWYRIWEVYPNSLPKVIDFSNAYNFFTHEYSFGIKIHPKKVEYYESDTEILIGFDIKNCAISLFGDMVEESDIMITLINDIIMNYGMHKAVSKNILDKCYQEMKDYLAKHNVGTSSWTEKDVEGMCYSMGAVIKSYNMSNTDKLKSSPTLYKIANDFYRWVIDTKFRDSFRMYEQCFKGISNRGFIPVMKVNKSTDKCQGWTTPNIDSDRKGLSRQIALNDVSRQDIITYIRNIPLSLFTIDNGLY